MNDHQRLASFIQDIKFTMMTTAGKDGAMYSRPMATLKIDEKNFDGVLYFFTKLHSPKVSEIEQDQHMNLAYANTKNQQYASVCGRASISQDKALMKKLWNPIFKAWFPEGLEDPEIALIAVRVESAEIWDSPPSKVVQLVGFVKAQVTGKAYNDKSHTEFLNMNQPHH